MTGAVTICKMPELPTNAAGKPSLDIVASHKLDADEYSQTLDRLAAFYPAPSF
jgi:hypothetical protein